jgi:hypothetical protein
MGYWDIGMRHIVDVDGQLLAIDAELIDSRSLLARANRPTDHQLWLVWRGQHFLVQPEQLVRLSEDEILFFESSSSTILPLPQQMAA